MLPIQAIAQALRVGVVDARVVPPAAAEAKDAVRQIAAALAKQPTSRLAFYDPADDLLKHPPSGSNAIWYDEQGNKFRGWIQGPNDDNGGRGRVKEYWSPERNKWCTWPACPEDVYQSPRGKIKTWEEYRKSIDHFHNFMKMQERLRGVPNRYDKVRREIA